MNDDDDDVFCCCCVCFEKETYVYHLSFSCFCRFYFFSLLDQGPLIDPAMPCLHREVPSIYSMQNAKENEEENGMQSLWESMHRNGRLYT